MDATEFLPIIAIGIVPVVVLVFLAVEGLKAYGFISGDGWLTAPRAGLTTGILLGIVAFAAELFPDIANYIATGATYIAGGLVAGLFYDLVGAGLLARVKAGLAGLFGISE
jgi:hypothetical protein